MPRCASNTKSNKRCSKNAKSSESLFCGCHEKNYINVEFKECSICLQDIIRNSKITSCGHDFHKECLRKWLYRNNVCPNCRTVIQDKKLYTLEDLLIILGF
jgi:hypothetical protein